MYIVHVCSSTWQYFQLGRESGEGEVERVGPGPPALVVDGEHIDTVAVFIERYHNAGGVIVLSVIGY